MSSVAAIPAQNSPTPDWKHLSFWLTIVAQIVGYALASGIVTNNTVLQALGIAGAVLSALGYKATEAIKTSSANKATAAIAVATATAAAAPAVAAAAATAALNHAQAIAATIANPNAAPTK